MILLGVFVASTWEASDASVVQIVADLPLLIFGEFVDDPENGSMSVRKELDLANFSKNPTSFVVLAIDELIHLEILVDHIFNYRVVLRYKLIKFGAKLKGIDNVSISQMELCQKGVFLGSAIVFDDVIVVDLHHQVLLIGYLGKFLERSFIVFLNSIKKENTKVEPTGRLKPYRLISTGLKF